MNDWWENKKSKTRKRRKSKGDYTKGDLFLDILLWIPELLLFPLRILLWLGRGLLRWVIDVI